MECDTHASHRLTAYMHLLKAIMKYHFSGTFILPTFDMVEQKYVTAEVFLESKILKPPKAGAKASKEAIEMWTEVSLASGDMYAEPSARKPGHQSANNCTVRGYRNI
ncbi:hypothetical protein HID58_030437, partial [Brassica napus]